MERRGNYYSQVETEALSLSRWASEPAASASSAGSRKKKKKSKNKRRFTDEQIRLLESIFESETKPEPVKKAQLARELGLQPRQVDIWFQNKRARWKSKQIEQEYGALRASYDALEFSFESLKKEKQSLHLQLQSLSDLLEKPREEGRGGEASSGLNFADRGSDNNVNTSRCGSEHEGGRGGGGFMCLDDDDCDDHEGDKMRSIGHLGSYDDDNLTYPGNMDNGFSTSPDEGEWGACLSSGELFGADQTGGSSQWWNFWP